MRVNGNIFVLCCLLALLPVAAGCIPLMVGAAAGVGGYAWVQGALVKEFDVPVTTLYKASKSALEDMKVEILEDRADRLSAAITANFADGNKVKVNIEALTELSARIKIRVGLVGDKVRSEMVYEAIKDRL